MTVSQRPEFSVLLKRYVPWVLAAAIFLYLFNRINPHEFIVAFGRVDMWRFLPIVVLYGLSFLFLDVLVFTLMFKSFGADVGYREMLPARGVSFILMIIHYMAGQGGFALIMNRWKKLSVSRAAGIVFWSMYIDYYSLLLFCVVGAFRLPDVDIVNFFSRGEDGDLVRFLTISWFVFFMVWLFFRGILPRTGRLGGLRESDAAVGFVESPPLRYVKFIGLKVPQYTVAMVTTYFALQAFGLEVPFLELSVMLPLVWLIGAIPVTPMRLGTTQAAMVWLVARYVQAGDMDNAEVEAAVFAFSMLWEAFLLLVRFIIGVISLKWMPPGVWKEKAEG